MRFKCACQQFTVKYIAVYTAINVKISVAGFGGSQCQLLVERLSLCVKFSKNKKVQKAAHRSVHQHGNELRCDEQSVLM